MSRDSPDGTVLSNHPRTTMLIGSVLGRALRAGDVVELNGPLGAGKTCLVRGILAGMGGDQEAVRSPTFVIHQPHRGTNLTLHHIDLYRLGDAADIAFLDLDGLLAAGVAVIEWGENADLAGFGATRLQIETGVGDQRSLRLMPDAADHLRRAWGSLVGAMSRP